MTITMTTYNFQTGKKVRNYYYYCCGLLLFCALRFVSNGGGAYAALLYFVVHAVLWNRIFFSNIQITCVIRLRDYLMLTTTSNRLHVLERVKKNTRWNDSIFRTIFKFVVLDISVVFITVVWHHPTHFEFFLLCLLLSVALRCYFHLSTWFSLRKNFMHSIKITKNKKTKRIHSKTPTLLLTMPTNCKEITQENESSVRRNDPIDR